MTVPVMILNWNGWDDTFECLRSLRESADVEQVWLVDNCSAVDRSSEATTIYPELRVLRWDKNYGYAGGYNRALKMAAAEGFEFAYLLNNDTVVTPGFLSAVVEAADSDNRIAAVGSRIAYADPANFVEFDGRLYAPGVHPFRQETGVKAVRAVVGAGMLVRLQAMEEHGYFDERFYCYHEELEWCFRMIDRGLSCAVSMDSVVIHKSQGSDRNANGIYYWHRNRFLLLERLDNETRKDGLEKWLYQAAVTAEMARRSGNYQEWSAIACAVDDAVRGRFGKRPEQQAGMIPAVRLVWLSLRAHLHDKWQSLRGRKPGYGEGLKALDPGW